MTGGVLEVGIRNYVLPNRNVRTILYILIYGIILYFQGGKTHPSIKSKIDALSVTVSSVHKIWYMF